MLQIDERNKLILSHIHLADKIACCRKNKVPYHIGMDELKSAAYFGLVDAASKFNPEYKSFSGYAAIRITGSIIDFLRELGWGSKCQYSMVFCSDDSPLDKWVVATPEDDFEKFFEIIKNLPNLYQNMLFWYYGNNYNMREIGLKLNVSESRVSQVISQCKKMLKKQWSKENLYECIY